MHTLCGAAMASIPCDASQDTRLECPSRTTGTDRTSSQSNHSEAYPKEMSTSQPPPRVVTGGQQELLTRYWDEIPSSWQVHWALPGCDYSIFHAAAQGLGATALGLTHDFRSRRNSNCGLGRDSNLPRSSSTSLHCVAHGTERHAEMERVETIPDGALSYPCTEEASQFCLDLFGDPCSAPCRSGGGQTSTSNSENANERISSIQPVSDVEKDGVIDPLASEPWQSGLETGEDILNPSPTIEDCTHNPHVGFLEGSTRTSDPALLFDLPAKVGPATFEGTGPHGSQKEAGPPILLDGSLQRHQGATCTQEESSFPSDCNQYPAPNPFVAPSASTIDTVALEMKPDSVFAKCPGFAHVNEPPESNPCLQYGSSNEATAASSCSLLHPRTRLHDSSVAPPRRRGIRKPPTTGDINLAHLRTCFELPRPLAEENLGLKRTTFSNLCRFYNIPKWPFRTIRDARKRIAAHTGELNSENVRPERKRELEEDIDRLNRVVQLVHEEPQLSKDSNTLSVFLRIVDEREKRKSLSELERSFQGQVMPWVDGGITHHVDQSNCCE